jgi:hypothetical protein
VSLKQPDNLRNSSFGTIPYKKRPKFDTKVFSRQFVSQQNAKSINQKQNSNNIKSPKFYSNSPYKNSKELFSNTYKNKRKVVPLVFTEPDLSDN